MLNLNDKDALRNKLINDVFLNGDSKQPSLQSIFNDNMHFIKENNIDNNTLLLIKKDIIELLTKKYGYSIKQLELPVATFIDNLKRAQLIQENYNFKYIP